MLARFGCKFLIRFFPDGEDRAITQPEFLLVIAMPSSGPQ
ncbi:hypothetical protein SynMVIR181_00089 [Synechococcus sp. MVIR-18-1]|nr:hypothetical protein SynMVIR181_00089 [Synechococcus sp. MVIR-18-1]